MIQPVTQPAPLDSADGTWVRVAALADLAEKGAKVVKVGRKQIVLWHGDKRVYACNNRCPHEGYPLKEGHFANGCILTCNWHNWKFDLESGETLIGGDKLRRYPVDIINGDIYLDVSDPPGPERAAAALAALKDSFRRLEYDRMGRELARLAAAGADPLDGVRHAFAWTHDRLEYGSTHAQAAAADWLALRRDLAADAADDLVPLMEIVGHLAYDSLREFEYPFPTEVRPYTPEALVQAIENEDEVDAVARVRDALRNGLTFQDLLNPLSRAALAHYADFGHAIIYVHKTGQLLAFLGPQSTEPLVLALVRSLCYAYREDFIPEFRGYAEAVVKLAKKLPTAGDGNVPAPEAFRGLSAKQAMARCVAADASAERLFDALLGASAWNLLHFNTDFEQRTDRPVSDNVGWLSFTHAITFAEAVWATCQRQPELWPAGLLQMACFVGRNSAYVDGTLDVTPWRVADPSAFLRDEGRALFDHGQFEHIISAHLIKTWAAAGALVQACPQAPWVDDLTASLNRFLHTPSKRRHSRRTARQSLEFVAREG